MNCKMMIAAVMLSATSVTAVKLTEEDWPSVCYLSNTRESCEANPCEEGKACGEFCHWIDDPIKGINCFEDFLFEEECNTVFEIEGQWGVKRSLASCDKFKGCFWAPATPPAADGSGGAEAKCSTRWNFSGLGLDNNGNPI